MKKNIKLFSMIILVVGFFSLVINANAYYVKETAVIDEGIYSIKNTKSLKYMQKDNGGSTHLEQFEKSKVTNYYYLWIFDKIEKEDYVIEGLTVNGEKQYFSYDEGLFGNYRIINYETKERLYVDDNNNLRLDSNACEAICDKRNSTFIIEQSGDSFCFKNMQTNKYISYGLFSTNGSNVTVSNNSEKSKWNIYKADRFSFFTAKDNNAMNKKYLVNSDDAYSLFKSAGSNIKNKGTAIIENVCEAYFPKTSQEKLINGAKFVTIRDFSRICNDTVFMGNIVYSDTLSCFDLKDAICIYFVNNSADFDNKLLELSIKRGAKTAVGIIGYHNKEQINQWAETFELYLLQGFTIENAVYLANKYSNNSVVGIVCGNKNITLKSF